ncbi:glycoprotein [Streptomyces sp. LP05-1]|uniref:Glycoprotein n=1 Tax=Streptomyces pyxinae TaxID=2970734 RepID=A0ABT2CDA5_9ACTN|nr:glycoprotein [Streptomyces sp. LP05-1]MCS0634741.1 glycoprotein [Streptomyces sp. LP05-1]
MRPTDDRPEQIDLVLGDSEILADTYDDYDTEAALERVYRLAEAEEAGERESSGESREFQEPRAPERPPAPRPPFFSAHEQAAHDLDLAVALIVDAQQAHVSLAGLLDHDDIQPEGALVFAALLHLAGYGQEARFWFEFAAGAGSRTAAFCCFLIHQRQAEYRDARHWRVQARRLPGSCANRATGRHPLLPEHVRHDLISRCQQGRPLGLPPRLEAVINSLTVDRADEDFGEIPQPDSRLTRLGSTPC